MIKKKAYAKFDLGVSINPNKADDGYFPVDYVDCQLDLYDELSFEAKENDIEIICSDKSLPADETNFVYRAADLLRKQAGNPNLGAKISLIKNIPVKAGFGGGSSDGAATLHGLCELWGIEVNDKQVKDLARELGKDFFYSVYGGFAEITGEGRSYEVKKLASKLPEIWVVVVVPSDQKPSTGWVYDHLNLEEDKDNLDKLVNLKKFMGKSDKIGILKNISNDFEKSVSFHYPIVNKMKADLINSGAQASIMAGAGLSVVGFFNSQEEAETSASQFKEKYKIVIVSKLMN